MVDLSKASAGGKPAVTRDLPQLWSVPQMYFTRMQGWRCPGHTEVPSHVMPSWPTLSSLASPGKPSPSKDSRSHSFAHGCTNPDRHHCPSPSSPNLPSALAVMLK